MQEYSVVEQELDAMVEDAREGKLRRGRYHCGAVFAEASNSAAHDHLRSFQHLRPSLASVYPNPLSISSSTCIGLLSMSHTWLSLSHTALKIEAWALSHSEHASS